MWEHELQPKLDRTPKSSLINWRKESKAWLSTWKHSTSTIWRTTASCLIWKMRIRLAEWMLLWSQKRTKTLSKNKEQIQRCKNQNKHSRQCRISNRMRTCSRVWELTSTQLVTRVSSNNRRRLSSLPKESARVERVSISKTYKRRVLTKMVSQYWPIMLNLLIWIKTNLRMLASHPKIMRMRVRKSLNLKCQFKV